MKEPDYEKLRSLLRSAVQPAGERGPEDDLWPRMLARIDRRRDSAPWLDFALGGLAATSLCAFPQMIPWMLLHF